MTRRLAAGAVLLGAACCSRAVVGR